MRRIFFCVNFSAIKIWPKNSKFNKLVFVFSISISLLYLIQTTEDLIRKSKFFRRPLSYENISNSEQEDLNLISFIAEDVIKSPSGQAYNLSYPQKEDYSQFGQGKYLEDYFKAMRYGTFIEAGAFDGEQFSNTLIFEQKYGWRGLLIEPDPLNFKELLSKHRKAYLSECCLSLVQRPQEMSFKLDQAVSRIIRSYDINVTTAMVRCYPLYSLMVAQNLATIDLLSLDIEGCELKVLQTLPWDKINIKSILVEVNHIPEGPDKLETFLKTKNYVLQKEFDNDYFFTKKYP